MGRPRKHNKHLPPNVQESHGAWFYVKGGKWHSPPLGHDIVTALANYARRFQHAGAGLDALIDRTLETLRSRKANPISANTAKQYSIAAEKLKRIFRDFSDPRDVLPRHIVELRQGLAETPNMANRVLSFVRQVFDQALEESLVDSNPAIGVKRLAEKKRDRLLTRAELEAIYSHAGPRLRVIIDLLIRTGQRIDDVLAIRRSDITADGIYFEQKKTGAKVLVKSTPELREVVDRARSLYGNIVALTLLHNRRGKRPDYRSVLLQWHTARKAAGVEDATPHDLRAVAGTEGRKQGKNPTALLGHTSTKQTERYLRDRLPTVAEGPSFGRLLGDRKN